MQKTLHVPYIADLDFLNTDAIFNRLESSGVRHSIGELNWKDLFPYHPLTTFTIAHSDNHIYINFFVRCNYLRAMNFENNSPVYEDSCVMFFVKPDRSEKYWNFEFNCIGAIKASHRESRAVNVTPLSDSEISTIAVLPSCGRRPFREVEGLFTWDLLAAIPLNLLGIKFDGKPVELSGNFYKCASGTSQPHYLSWAPVPTPEPDFHQPQYFGQIILDGVSD